MSKSDEYRRTLREMTEWDAYLLSHSGLPGPRGNIELGRAVAQEGDGALFQRYLSNTADKAPENTPASFLAFCGVLGLGRLLAEGGRHHLPAVRALANDPRWRIREAVAMALQAWGHADMPGLLAEMRHWAAGTLLEQRAAAAALCEPSLLSEPDHARQVLAMLDDIMTHIEAVQDRRSDPFRALRKGMAYCWSVAVAAYPEPGKQAMERWFASRDPDTRWIMRQNLAKKRLARLDPAWVSLWQERLGGG